MKLKHPQQDKLLWISDSITSNVDFVFLSRQTNCNIKSVKAYNIAPDTGDSLFPNQNFLDVVDAELESSSYKTLVLGGGSVDITNLNTLDNPIDSITEYREKIIISAQKMFCIAESAIHTHPSLEKVIILKNTPRFDLSSKDPLGLKPQFSALVDSIIFGLWCESRFRDSIILGEHDIPEHLHKEAFGSLDDKGYDGLHLKGCEGKTILTKSIQKILLKGGIISPGMDTLYNPAINIQNSKSKLYPSSKNLYEPLGILKDDIKSRQERRKSASAPTANTQGSGHHDHHPDTQQSAQPAHCSTTRPSIFVKNSQHGPEKMNYKNNANVHFQYNVPVSNPFTCLGN